MRVLNIQYEFTYNNNSTCNPINLGESNIPINEMLAGGLL